MEGKKRISSGFLVQWNVLLLSTFSVIFLTLFLWNEGGAVNDNLIQSLHIYLIHPCDILALFITISSSFSFLHISHIHPFPMIENGIFFLVLFSSACTVYIVQFAFPFFFFFFFLFVHEEQWCHYLFITAITLILSSDSYTYAYFNVKWKKSENTLHETGYFNKI